MQRQPPPKPRITFGKFANVDMRVAQVESAAMAEGTAKPCRVLKLDVGTCTARYLMALRDAIRPDGEILGIDVDLDCVRFARWNLRQQCADDARLHVERQDFCAEEFAPKVPFDLITC